MGIINGAGTAYLSGTPELTPGFSGVHRLAAARDKAYQLLGHGRWFSPGTLASSTTKTSHHDIAEILLKVALNTINKSIKSFSRVCVTRSLALCVHFVDRCMSFCTFSFGHCVVCSSIYGF